MTIRRDSASAEAAPLTIRVAGAAPALIVACDLLDRFHAMIPVRKPDLLGGWIAAARDSGLASFASGIAADHAAARAAITEPRSTGQAEGQITKLKLVKRLMYGRAKLDRL